LLGKSFGDLAKSTEAFKSFDSIKKKH